MHVHIIFKLRININCLKSRKDVFKDKDTIFFLFYIQRKIVLFLCTEKYVFPCIAAVSACQDTSSGINVYYFWVNKITFWSTLR